MVAPIDGAVFGGGLENGRNEFTKLDELEQTQVVGAGAAPHASRRAAGHCFAL